MTDKSGSISSLNAATRKKLMQAGSATIANMLFKRGFRNRYMLGVNALSANQEPMVGAAYTLRFIPSREDIDTMANYDDETNLHRRAIEECPEGHVLIISTEGCLKSASAGDIMAARLAVRGVSGLVTDGGFRDAHAIKACKIPAYQKQSAPPATPIAMHPVELNGPVGCGGVAVYPGDIIVGDEEGVVVIPAEIADEISEEAFSAEQYELFVNMQIKQGRSIFGLFPATPESLEEYQAWVKIGRP